MSRSWPLLGVPALALVGLVSACDETDTDTTPPPPVTVTPAEFGAPHETLSEWHLFAAPGASLEPAERVVPYDVIAPLFSDYTTKYRYVWVPEGEKIAYSDDGAWDFPVGTILVKVFSYPADIRRPDDALRIIETRILWREPDGWTPHTYIWNEDQTEAQRTVAGKSIAVEFIGIDGETVTSDYRVPNTNECKRCHSDSVAGGEDVVRILGPTTSQLDRNHDYGDGPINQIDHFKQLGLFAAEPTQADQRTHFVDPADTTADLSLRARSYLDANCSSCHRTGGFAAQSALLLDFGSTDPETDDPANWGVCKVPTSAEDTGGRTFDVVPGHPELSILTYRMETLKTETRMPPLGSRIVHSEGVALMNAWISSLPPAACTPP